MVSISVMSNDGVTILCLDIYKSASHYSKLHDWFISVNMQTGRYSSPYSHALDAYWPGLLVRKHVRYHSMCLYIM